MSYLKYKLKTKRVFSDTFILHFYLKIKKTSFQNEFVLQLRHTCLYVINAELPSSSLVVIGWYKNLWKP